MDQVVDKNEMNVYGGNGTGYQTIQTCSGQWEVDLKDVAEGWRRDKFPVKDDGNIDFEIPSRE